jgi:hypothetical protein
VTAAVLAIGGEFVHVGIVVEGAVDYALGRPLSGNPYAPDYEPCYSAWAVGWEEAHEVFPRERLFREFVPTWLRWPAEERWAA